MNGSRQLTRRREMQVIQLEKIQMVVHDHHVYIFIKMYFYIPRSIPSSLFENVEDKLGIKKELCSSLDESLC
jgi:hypothetical protein